MSRARRREPPAVRSGVRWGLGPPGRRRPGGGTAADRRARDHRGRRVPAVVGAGWGPLVGGAAGRAAGEAVSGRRAGSGSVQLGDLVGVRWRSGAAAESRTVSGRLEPGIGTTTGDVASIHARHTRCGLTPCASAIRANAACRVPRPEASEMPPSGLQGRKAMPSSSHSRSSGSLERNAGENWFCTDTSRPPRISSACRIWPGSALEMPAIRILPASSSSRRAPIESA